MKEVEVKNLSAQGEHQELFRQAWGELELAIGQIGLTFQTIDGDLSVNPYQDIDLFVMSNRDQAHEQPYPPVLLALPHGLPVSFNAQQARPDGFSFDVFPLGHPQRHSVFIAAKNIGIIPNKGFVDGWGTQIDYRYGDKRISGNIALLQGGELAKHIPQSVEVVPELYIVMLGMYGLTSVDHRDLAAIASLTKPLVLSKDIIEVAPEPPMVDELYVALQIKEQRRRGEKIDKKVSTNTQLLLSYLLGATYDLDLEAAEEALDQIIGPDEMDESLIALKAAFLEDLRQQSGVEKKSC